MAGLLMETLSMFFYSHLGKHVLCFYSFFGKIDSFEHSLSAIKKIQPNNKNNV